MKIQFDLKKIPAVLAVFILVFGIILFRNDIGIIGNFVIIAMLIGVLPYVLMSYFDYQKIKLIEEQFPTFLRDLAESQKAGTNLPDALRNASKVDYGRLTGEIKRISDQLSWGVPLQEVLDRFSKRMRKSDLIARSVRLINEAYSSGGDIAETMEANAVDVNAIKEAEKERRSMMAQHVTMMYMIYFIFVGIVLALSKTLLPMLEMNVAGGLVGFGGFQDPCIGCPAGGFFCVSCSTFSTISSVFSLGAGAAAYYRSIFLSMILIQGIFTGIVSGQIGENSAMAGVKHSLIMTAVGFGVFIIAFRLGII